MLADVYDEQSVRRSEGREENVGGHPEGEGAHTQLVLGGVTQEVEQVLEACQLLSSSNQLWLGTTILSVARHATIRQHGMMIMRTSVVWVVVLWGG